VGRIYRRVCFLRFEGLGQEASRIEFTELKEAVDAARKACASGLEADSILKSLFEEEGERVAEAMAFAEVLVPMLADRIPALQAERTRVPARASVVPRMSREPLGETPSVADFIDGMLEQERPGAH